MLWATPISGGGSPAAMMTNPEERPHRWSCAVRWKAPARRWPSCRQALLDGERAARLIAPRASHARAAERTDQVHAARPQLAQAHVQPAVRRLAPVAVVAGDGHGHAARGHQIATVIA